LSLGLATLARRHPQGGLLVLISDLLDVAPSPGGGAAELAEGLRHLAPPRWQVWVVHLLSEQEVRPTLEGDFDLQDVETHERSPFHLDERTRSSYRVRVRRWCGELYAACARRGATYSRVLAEWPFERAVIPYLRRRGLFQ
jgi:hypothetical protein